MKLIVCVCIITLLSLVDARSLHSSTWAATDDLNRTVPDWRHTGSIHDKGDHLIGMFYFLWHINSYTGPYDNTKLLAAAGGNRSRVQYGPVGAPHHWGESLFSYYVTSDEWVTRKHASLLTDALVDYVIFDMTNAFTYPESYTPLLNSWTSMREAGNETPNFAIIVHASIGPTVQTIYEALYKPGLYKDMWQMWEGKPLILGNSSECDPDIASFFTWRQSWADTSGAWFGDGKDAWPWIDEYPQGFGWHEKPTIKEEMAITCAGWPTLNLGKSFDGYTHTQPLPDKFNTKVGHYFRQQYEHALNATCHDDDFICDNAGEDSILPRTVFITGWNEGFAQRFLVQPGQQIDFLGERLDVNDTYFVDEYIEEYSRDIEPMMGGHGDNYYYQLAAFNRWLKGSEPQEKSSPPQTITINQNFTQWYETRPIYYDTVNDTQHRSHPGFGNTGLYFTDNSTIDDLCTAQTTLDSSNVYFHVKTCHSFNPDHSSASEAPHLSLFLRTDHHEAGALGYNWKLNVTESTLYRSVESDQWKAVMTDVSLAWNTAELHCALPRKVLFPDAPSHVRIEFKWISFTDWALTINKPIEFQLYGDVAPNARWNYVYEQEIDGLLDVASLAYE